MTVFVGVDFGRKRIGLAILEAQTGVAVPREVIPSRPRRESIQHILDLAQQLDADIVVGLPLRLDGSEQSLTRSARAFADTLRHASGRAVHLHDETLSSVEAEQRAREAGRGRRDAIDDLAAQIVLESFWQARSSSDPLTDTEDLS